MKLWGVDLYATVTVEVYEWPYSTRPDDFMSQKVGGLYVIEALSCDKAVERAMEFARLQSWEHPQIVSCLHLGDFCDILR